MDRFAMREKKIDILIEKLKEKIGVSTGFADPEVQVQALVNSFKVFDAAKTGVIDYKLFCAAMNKFNFVGVQREIEDLFNKFDGDGAGVIDYKVFSFNIFGLSNAGPIRADGETRNIISAIRADIVRIAGADGIHQFCNAIVNMNPSNGNLITIDELKDCFQYYGVSCDAGSLQKLFRCCDFDKMNTVCGTDLARAVKMSISFERKQMVRQAFALLDKFNTGAASLQDILECYDPLSHPSVEANICSSKQCVQQMQTVFGFVEGQHSFDDFAVSWVQFLDYYQGISCAIPSDDRAFEITVRNAWPTLTSTVNGSFAEDPVMSNSSSMMMTTAGSFGYGGFGGSVGVCRRVMVVLSNGSERVIDVQDDFGLGKFDRNTVLEKVRQLGIRDAVDVRLAEGPGANRK